MGDNKDAIRLNTVRRVDPHVVSIVESASGTALYTYEDDLSSWTKTDIEGTLMVYTREAPPYNMITIINRKTKSNFVETLSPLCDLQVKTPYLLFKNEKRTIYCIWFRIAEDVIRISTAISKQISDTQTPNIFQDPAVAAAQSNGKDIMSMLMKAHGDFHDQKDSGASHGSLNDLIRPAPVRIDTCPANPVADFLAKVSQVPSGSVNPPNVQCTVPPTENNSDDVLEQLFQGAGMQGQLNHTVSSAATPIKIPSISSNMDSVSSLGMSLEELEGKLKGSLHVSGRENDLFVSSPYPSKLAESSSLLSPQTFVTATEKNSIIASLLSNQPVCSSEESIMDTPNCQSDPPSTITPLTQEQFVKAFTHLLQKEDFVKQLYNAYVDSIGKSMSNT